MKLLKNFTLAVCMKTDPKNKSFFREKLLGVEAGEWLPEALKESFGEVACVKDTETLKKRQASLKYEHVVCLYWDTPLVRETDLVKYCDNYMRVKKQISLPKGFIFHRSEDFSESEPRPSGAFAELAARNFPEIYGKLQAEIISEHLGKGVFIFGTEGLAIDKTVRICGGARIFGPCSVKGKTKISKDARIYPNCFIEDAQIGAGCEIRSSVILGAQVGDGTVVGPFAYLRPGTVIGKNCRIGDFVELKNSSLGDGTKASHHAYIGDAEIGCSVNIGCGVVFANYDGKLKHKTVVEDNAFIGCNVNLVAPVTVGKFGFVAAGTTVTENVPPGDLAIGRVKPVLKENGGIKRLT